MTSIDDLFKKPGLPLSNKRKFETPNAHQAYKATKISNGSSPNGAAASGADEEEDDAEAGPELPPDDDDEDGRFFGTGITRDGADALDYINQDDGETYEDEKIDSAWLRRLVTTFERKVKKNAELRAKFDGEPQKFMASEADLDAEIKSWSLLSEYPKLYPEFAESASVTSLVGLLAHENTDVAIGAIEIISELLDEDVEAEQEQWDTLAAALLEADLLELLMSNLERLDEEHETDRSGVYHSLSVIESLAGQQSLAEKIGEEKVLLWLCNRMNKLEPSIGQNKQYAAEVLQVLLQSSPLLRRRLTNDLDGVDLFLRHLAAYRKRDPAKDSHEEEYVENLFDSLTCTVDEPDGKRKFVQAEGVELCRIMIQEGTKNIMPRALRVMDHAVAGSGQEAAKVCDRVVTAGLLKPMFSIFMKKGTMGGPVEHLLGIFSALLRSLPGESASRIRLLAKFTEKDLEKVSRLERLRGDYARLVGAVDKEIKLEQKNLPDDEIEARADEWFSRRLGGGLFCLQTVDVILAWLVAEDPAVKTKISTLSGDVKQSLQEQRDGLERGNEGDEDTREMLETLIGFLA